MCAGDADAQVTRFGHTQQCWYVRATLMPRWPCLTPLNNVEVLDEVYQDLRLEINGNLPHENKEANGAGADQMIWILKDSRYCCRWRSGNHGRALPSTNGRRNHPMSSAGKGVPEDRRLEQARSNQSRSRGDIKTASLFFVLPAGDNPYNKMAGQDLCMISQCCEHMDPMEWQP